MTGPNLEDVYELSPMQQGILFHTLYDPVADLYLEQCVISLGGRLDPQRLERAWRAVARRHPILRTSFHWEGLEKPVQVVHPDAPLPFRLEDWRDVPEETWRNRLDAYLLADRKAGFDLASAPLLRVAVFRTSDHSAECVLTFQHLLLDRWSRFIVLNEVIADYEADGHPPVPSARPYGDYIAWLQSQDRKKAEAFWREYLGSFPGSAALGGDAPEGSSAPGPTQARLALSPEESVAIQSFARKHRLTTSTLIQGAWAFLVSRYTGERDVVFGTTVSGRPPALEGVENMVGLFINTLPVRVDVSGEQRVGEWLERMQARLLELREFEHSSLIDIQGWSEVPRGVALFQTVVVFENTGGQPESAASAGLAMTRVRSLGGATNFSLTLYAVPGTRLGFQIQSTEADFPEEALSRMMNQLRAILLAIIGDPERRLAEISMLPDDERRRLLVEWNATAREYPPTLVHEMFEARAEREPDAPAVRCESGSLTYRMLNERANQLAHRLRAMGVGTAQRVLLCVDRSPEMLVALLGVLKAGGAYVPLDPAYPPARLAFMMGDANPAVLITEERSAGNLSGFTGPAILLDRDAALLDVEPVSNPEGTARPGDLAYVIYTSGSSGQPKGVGVEHRSLTNLLFAMQDALRLNREDVMLAVTTLSFDIAALELYLPLASGASIALASRAQASDGEALLAELRRSGATAMQATPVTWQILLAAGWKGEGLRVVLCGGEALRRELANRLFDTCGGFWNMYGPTETTIWSTMHRVESRVEAAAAPIGRPISNTRLYVLEPEGGLVPPGLPGELFIGGEGVSRGYWNRAELTEERFRRLEYETGSRAYQTGDLVRYRRDGTLEFLGRLDGQVKIRGFRIEVGEVEDVLLRHASVQECVVVPREDEGGEKNLIAYVVLGPAGPSTAELRAHAKDALPEHMVPASFVSLESLPRTPNGKVDRRALPSPGAVRSHAPHVPPASPVEQGLAEIWKEILKIDRPSLEDSFFERGGHSLLATRLVSRIAESFNTRIPLRDVFEHPTLGGLAASIAGAMAMVQTSGEMLEMLAEVQSLSDAEAQDRLVIESQSDPVKVARPRT